MTRIFISFFIFSIIHLPAFTQSLILDWTQEYPTNSISVLFQNVLADENENVYTCGYSYHIAFTIGFLSLKYDSTGNFLWDAKFDYFFPDKIRDCELSESGLIIAGTVNNAPAGGYGRSLMISYNEDGGEIWNRYIYDFEQYSSVVLGIEIDHENRVYAFGAQIDYSASDTIQRMYIDRIDHDTGETIWSHNYYDGAAFLNRAFDGIILEDRIRAFGMNHKSGKYNIVLHDVSLDGDSLATTEFLNDKDITDNYCFDINGEFVVTDEYMCKLLMAGDTAWCFDFTQGMPQTYGRGEAVVSDEMGNIYSTGWILDSTVMEQSTVTCKISPEGDLIWYAIKDVEGIADVSTHLAISEKYVFVGGGTYSGSPQFKQNFRPLLLSAETGEVYTDTIIDIQHRDIVGAVSSDGTHFYMTGVSLTTAQDIENQSILKFSVEKPNSVREVEPGAVEIYPNPVSEAFVIFQKERMDFESFELFDVSGALVLSGFLENRETMINVKDFPKGMYLLKMMGDNHYLTRKIVKQ